MTECASVDRVTFFSADNETIFQVRCVPVGMDAKRYAQDWINWEQRRGTPSRPYLIERGGTASQSKHRNAQSADALAATPRRAVSTEGQEIIIKPEALTSFMYRHPISRSSNLRPLPAVPCRKLGGTCAPRTTCTANYSPLHFRASVLSTDAIALFASNMISPSTSTSALDVMRRSSLRRDRQRSCAAHTIKADIRYPIVATRFLK